MHVNSYLLRLENNDIEFGTLKVEAGLILKP